MRTTMNNASPSRLLSQARRAATRLAAITALAAAAVGWASPASAQCNSENPADWPESDKPYFLFLVDTSGSMGACTNPEAPYCDGTNTGPATCNSSATPNACGWEPSRINDAKCALSQAVTAFSGEATFGLASFDAEVSGCAASLACDTAADPTAGGTCGGDYVTSPAGCSTYTDACSGSSNGGRVLVPLVDSSGNASSAADVLRWVDGECGDAVVGQTSGGVDIIRSQELFAFGGTPLAKSIGWMGDYFSTTGADDFGSPLATTDRACREVHLIVLSDGDPDGCDEGSAADEALALYNGVLRSDGTPISVKTHMIGFGSEVDIGVLSEVARMGQCGTTTASAACPTFSEPDRQAGHVTAVQASNSAELASAFAEIIAEAIRPEDCNNADDNCNGCVDEGYAHYQNTRSDCCSGDRAACLAAYVDDPIASNLPCVSDNTDSSTWLCFDGGEECDSLDNNGDGEVDEGFGDPVCCPTGEEICGNDVDEDCDGVIEYTCQSCTPLQSGEVCNGLDDDCDGDVDEELMPINCGSDVAPYGPACAGVRVCDSGSYTACSATGSTEICDALDNDCDGVINEGISARTCAPDGVSAGNYDTASSACESGLEECGGSGWTGTCIGAVGPSSEICDGIDNDCDGDVDEAEDIPAVGVACGVGGNGCIKGTQACVDGEMVCQGGTQPEPEECDGIDNDCDGAIDEGLLTDAPSNSACWPLDGTGCSGLSGCSHDGLTWCPPPGGECQGMGSSLASPCALGTLVCGGATGWECQGGRIPTDEVCDNVDNDCDGTVDDNPTDPLLGDACSSAVGECTPGQWICDLGTLLCDGDLPDAEVCDGLDNDCDGTPDDGLPLDAACLMADYDPALYPGERSQGECVPGRLQCDASTSGEYLCTGGKGPSPEVCDGKDNDCDGLIDESGPAPDGIDGSVDPLDDTRTLGDACGSTEGECEAGVLGCALGHVACLGGVGPQREVCDCADNDCDGEVDEDAEVDETDLCTSGKTCVDAGDFCACAFGCLRGEFPCQTGTACDEVPRSGTEEEGRYCVPEDPCANCETITARTVDGNALCGPAGTMNLQGLSVPECVCLGTHCGPPCQGIVCSEPGTACVPSGDAAGTCQQQGNCHYFGCSFGEACSDKACVDNPCLPNPCEEEQACKPNSTFTEPRCVASCNGVSCGSDETCVEGSCVADPCGGSCTADQACIQGADGYACGEPRCTTCSDGKYCDPAVGCINHPCEGVVCPTAQGCLEGECVDQALLTTAGNPTDPGGTDDGNDPTDSTGSTGDDPTRGLGGETGDGDGAGGDGDGSSEKSGCSCSAVGTDQPARTPVPATWALLLPLAVFWRRRRRPTECVAIATKGGAR